MNHFKLCAIKPWSSVKYRRRQAQQDSTRWSEVAQEALKRIVSEMAKVCGKELTLRMRHKNCSFSADDRFQCASVAFDLVVTKNFCGLPVTRRIAVINAFYLKIGDEVSETVVFQNPPSKWNPAQGGVKVSDFRADEGEKLLREITQAKTANQLCL